MYTDLYSQNIVKKYYLVYFLRKSKKKFLQFYTLVILHNMFEKLLWIYFRISATYGIRTTSYREILYFNDNDGTGDRVFISNGKKTNTRRDRERERRESASVARRR